MLKLEDTILAYVLSAEDKKGGLVLSAKTTVGDLKFKFWKPNENTPSAGNYMELRALDMEAAKEEVSRWKSISLDSKYDKKPNYSFRMVPEDDVPSDIRSAINKDRKAQIVAARDILLDPSPWRDAQIHKMLLKFMTENKEAFFNAPAAVDNHHAWRGGLLVHTAEVASYCLSIVESPVNKRRNAGIDLDALLLAAWFHDTGKIETYSMEGDGCAIDSELENMVGHITLSNLKFSEFSIRTMS